MNLERISRALIFEALLQHPLPWRIEEDWTCEIRAVDGAIIARFQTVAEARAIVELAHAIRAEVDALAEP